MIRWRVLPTLAISGVLLASLWSNLPTRAATSFADPAFQVQWQATEASVANFWGPLGSATDGMQEPYREATGGQRLVQYFDKARMELTDPRSGGVTNGLLTVELVSGRLQIGDDTFLASVPAEIPVAGDENNPWPPYRALNSTTFPERVAQNTAPVGQVYNPDGSFSAD